MVAAPAWGKISDRTTARIGMRRPWMIVGVSGGLVSALVMALAPNVPILLVGFCLSQLFLNAAGAVLTAVLADRVPPEQRGTVSGLLGVGGPLGLVLGTFLVQLVDPNFFLMFLLPPVVGGMAILAFTAVLPDRRLDKAAPQTAFSVKDLVSTFTFNPRRNPDFAWAWGSRFLFSFAVAILNTYLTFYLINHLGSDKQDVPHQVFLGTLVLAVFAAISSVVGGKISDATGRRKQFVIIAAVLFALSLFLVTVASDLTLFLVGAAVGGLGLGAYTSVELALVTAVLPDQDNTAKDLGVFNIANNLPTSLAPAIAPVILYIGSDSYAFLYAVAGASALLSAMAIAPVSKTR